ncbi:Thioredoxin domain protein [Staphylococcus epidermidis VCU036]|nr:Thioredoxin domain protein [Staphylococcus epidermidis VCU036]
MMNIPILKHTIEFLNIIARVFHRDDDTHLIDQYLTNGKSRAIPIFVFMNDSFEQLTVWRPRAKKYKVLSIKLEVINCQIKPILILRNDLKKHISLLVKDIKLIQYFGNQFLTQ